jgi:membrane protease YdiL (CAAX protease family)
MNKIATWIRGHQIVAFFVITFAITWGLGFAWIAVMRHEQYLLLPLAFVSVCGPGLAGIIVSAVTNTQPRQGTRKTFWLAFLVAWIVSAVVFLANFRFIEHVSVSPVVVGLIAISVLPVAFVISSTYSRIRAVRIYLSSLIRLRGVWGWALLGLVLFPALVVISAPVDSLLKRQPLPADLFPTMSWALVGLIVVKLLYQLFFFNATGEETGWRGFVLPRLQTRTSPLVAALIIAVFWVPWHIFGWQAEGQPISDWQYWGIMYIGHILLSILIVWICNRAGGSILVAGITHAATNTAQAFISVDFWGLYLTLFVAVLVLIVFDRMWEKLPADHPAVVQAPAPEGRRTLAVF